MQPPFLIIIVFVTISAVVAYYGYIQAKKRREAFQRLALDLGFSYLPEKDYNFAARFNFLEHMDDGSRRYAYNRLTGSIDAMPVDIFDYHYETYSRDSKGRRSTHHHYFSIFTLGLSRHFPELNIEPEGFFSKIGQALGFDDIDFESHEFSKRYQVKARDKKFSYDFCNTQMIEFLMAQHDLIIEVDGSTLALTFRGRLAADEIRPNLERLLKMRSLMPNYLFDD